MTRARQNKQSVSTCGGHDELCAWTIEDDLALIVPITLAELEAMGDLRIEEADHFGYKKKEFRLLRKRNYTNLSDREIALLGEMLQFVCYQNTARSISDFSHDIVWDMVDFGQDIPYHSVLNWLPSEVSVEALEEASAIRHSIEGTKPVRAVDLEGCVPTPLRARLARHAGQAAVS